MYRGRCVHSLADETAGKARMTGDSFNNFRLTSVAILRAGSALGRRKKNTKKHEKNSTSRLARRSRLAATRGSRPGPISTSMPSTFFRKRVSQSDSLEPESDVMYTPPWSVCERPWCLRRSSPCESIKNLPLASGGIFFFCCLRLGDEGTHEARYDPVVALRVVLLLVSAF